MKLVIRLGFQLGFVPIFHNPVSCSCLLPVPCFSNFHCHPMSQPHEWPSIAALGTKMQKMPILAESGRPGAANLNPYGQRFTGRAELFACRSLIEGKKEIFFLWWSAK